MGSDSRARAVVGAVALALPACWFADFGDLSGAYGDAGSSLDASALVDAGPGTDAASANAPFCPPDAGANTYCMDFDGVDAGALDLQVFGATAAIVNGPSVSPPSSLSVVVEGAASFGRYEVLFPLQPTSTTLEFEMQAPNIREGTTTLAISLLQPATETTRTLNVVVFPFAGFQVQEFFTFADGGTEIHAHGAGTLFDAGPSSAWHRVVLTLTVDDASMQYLSSLTVDGQPMEENVPLTLGWAQGTVGLHIGVTYAAMGGGSQFFFDNVRASFEM